MNEASRKPGFLPVAVIYLLVLIMSAAYIYSITYLVASEGEEEISRDLPVVGSYGNLKKLLKDLEAGYKRYSDEVTLLGPSAREKTADMTEGASAGIYSTTNLQVQGVDEADLVKTDGKYIYQVNEQEIIVARAYPPAEMQILKTISFNDKSFFPLEMFLDERNLVVIGMSHREIPHQQTEKMIYPPVYWQSTVRAVIYDISRIDNISFIREIELEGYYVSARKMDSCLYLVVNKNIDFIIMEGAFRSEFAPSEFTPSYRDTVWKEEYNRVQFQDIRYFPGFNTPNYLMVGGIDLDKPGEKMEVHTYLGAGHVIYASRDNLYVALSGYSSGSDPGPGPGQITTSVYKFGLNGALVAYAGKGEVPGVLLNQFSMDEHRGYFRIATTSGEMWRTGEETSRNNVYILDHSMHISGKIEGIAPGERIYSVRFMGDRGYMVTFRTVDPLFVMDLSDPRSPRILGELKIPGYSDYLHPYDENHLIGFGMDVIEETQTMPGNRTETIALVQGMKIALFDVSDVHNPVEKFNEFIGGRGTYSEVLRNHKALLFSRERNLMSFPVTVVDSTGPSRFEYGTFVFQGAYIYRITLEEGFFLKGKITHLSGADYREHYYGYRNIERILYIGDVLYTLSKAQIRATDLETLEEINTLHIR